MSTITARNIHPIPILEFKLRLQHGRILRLETCSVFLFVLRIYSCSNIAIMCSYNTDNPGTTINLTRTLHLNTYISTTATVLVLMLCFITYSKHRNMLLFVETLLKMSAMTHCLDETILGVELKSFGAAFFNYIDFFKTERKRCVLFL